MNLSRKQKHVNGELGMASMVDILFILLMFFMMISTLTSPSALPLSLPGSSAKNEKLTDNEKLTEIEISGDMQYLIDGVEGDTASIRTVVNKLTKGLPDPSKVNIIVSPGPTVGVENTVYAIDIITHAGANAVLNLVN
jgi:biopolymer transport protein ExbD